MQAGENLLQVGQTINQATSRRMDEMAAGNQNGIAGYGQTITNATRDCCATVDQMVHENTWQAVGIAFGVGLIAGLILRD